VRRRRELEEILRKCKEMRAAVSGEVVTDYFNGLFSFIIGLLFAQAAYI
jgi:hypothetical protein